jgi:hypothetical protein
MGDLRYSYNILLRKLVGKRPIWEPSNTWGDNVKTEFKEIECEDVEWIHLAREKDQ